MCKKTEELIDLYVSGDLEAAEAEQVENHLAGCEACRQEAESYRAHLSTLASLRSENQPDRLPPFFWQGIQKAILTEGDQAEERAVAVPPRRAVVGRKFVIALAAGLLFAAGAFLLVSVLTPSRSQPAPGAGTVAVQNGEEPQFLKPGTPVLPDSGFPQGEFMSPSGAPDNPSLEF